MNQTAADFLSRCFAVGDTIAFLLRRDNAERPTQRIVRLEQALAPTYLRWLAHENHGGSNVYVAANPLRAGSRKRTKESVASVRHLYIDIDTDGDARLATLRASDAAPTPSAILSTSPESTRYFGASMASTFRVRNRRSSYSPSPSAAIPLAPTATVFSGCRVS